MIVSQIPNINASVYYTCFNMGNKVSNYILLKLIQEEKYIDDYFDSTLVLFNIEEQIKNVVRFKYDRWTE